MENPYKSPRTEFAVRLQGQAGWDFTYYPKTALVLAVWTVAFALISLARPHHPGWLLLLNSSLVTASIACSLFELRRIDRFVPYVPVFLAPLVVLTFVLMSEGHRQLLRAFATGVIGWPILLMIVYVGTVWLYVALALRHSLASLQAARPLSQDRVS